MKNFAAELLPQKNESLQSARGADQWVTDMYSDLQEQLQGGNFGGPFGKPDALYSEYRLALPVDFNFSSRGSYYQRLEWRFMADGWNAAQVVQVDNFQVLVRLFALTEQTVVVADGIEPFPIQLRSPVWFEDYLPEFSIEGLAQSIAQDGAWRYSDVDREFIPPHRILGIRQTFSRQG